MSDKLVEALKAFWGIDPCENQAVTGLSGRGTCGITESKEE